MGTAGEGRMKRIKKKWGQRIYLEWIDACMRVGWKTLEDAMDAGDDTYCQTNAFYIGESRGFVVVAHTIGKSSNSDMTGILHIPKKWITKWK